MRWSLVFFSSFFFVSAHQSNLWLPTYICRLSTTFAISFASFSRSCESKVGIYVFEISIRTYILYMLNLFLFFDGWFMCMVLGRRFSQIMSVLDESSVSRDPTYFEHSEDSSYISDLEQGRELIRNCTLSPQVVVVCASIMRTGWYHQRHLGSCTSSIGSRTVSKRACCNDVRS